MNGENITNVVVIINTVDIRSRAGAAWEKIGSFSDAGTYLNISCKLIAGDGGVGSIRKIGDEIIEVLVGTSSNSYTYVQTQGPMASFSYHGCVALYAETSDTSRLVYTICYDQSLMDNDRRVFELDRISKRFTGAAEAMKYTAETL